MSRCIHPSRPRPFTTTTSAAATALASAGVGSNTWASPSGPTRVVTATRSPPTFFTISPRMLKLATTFSLPSAACAARGTSSKGAIRTTWRKDRRYMGGSPVLWESGLIVRPGDQVLTQAAMGADGHRGEVDDAGGQHDGRTGGQIEMERDEQADIAGHQGDRRAHGRQRPYRGGPETRGSGRQHHQPDRHQRAEGLEAGDEVEDDEDEEQDVVHRAMAADRAQEAGVEAFDQERAIDHRQRGDREARDRAHQEQRTVVHRQDGAEQHMHEIDVAAAGRDDEDAEGDRSEERRV